jgi:hypothetical protein
MEVTFGKFWNLLESQDDSTKSLDIIRSGNNLKKPDCGNFWDDFINLCGNADAVSELLGVPKEKVTSWSGAINKLRQEVEIKDSDKSNKKHKIIKNGE